MNRQRVMIKSSQIFGEHIDSIEEEHDAILEKFENGMKIVYDNTSITILDEVVMIDRENSKLVIEKEKRNSTEYVTPYGNIAVEVEGKEIKISEGPIMMELSYIIKVGNAKDYLNKLQIILCT
ncbi:MAG: DUF1934 domain-containing protein [Clostridia bacterium]|nr:DUF1934 domain-containing protein [Clostridia bacterium]